MKQLDGWKTAAAIIVGVVVGTCGTAATDWLGYSGFKERVAAAQTEAKAARSEAGEAQRRVDQNTSRIIALEKDVAEAKGGIDRVEQNLYEFLIRQPGLTPTPPPAKDD